MASRSAAFAGNVAPIGRIYNKKVPVGNDLFECFKNNVLCDVIIIADDGKRIPAHRVVLYAGSDYFKALFTNELKEHGQQEISIKEVDGDAFQQLIRYCYIGEISIDSENVEELTKAATMLQFNEVQDNCTAFYTTILSASNCLGIEEIADLHSMQPLKEAAHELVLDHFVEVSMSEQFHQLSADNLSTLLKDDEINVNSEEEVFTALMGWIKYDVSGRKGSLGTLMECVRFKHINDSFFHGIYQQCIELNSTELMSAIIALRSSEEHNQNNTPRRSTTSSTFNVAYRGGEMAIEIDRFISHRNIWKKVKTIKTKTDQFALVFHDAELIIIGGRDAQRQGTNTVSSINLNTNETADFPPMIHPRSVPIAQLLNNCIYVLGGRSLNTGVFPMERFDFESKEWTLVTPMQTPRCDCAHAVLSGLLFLIGGVNEQNRRLNSVEYYVPLTESWHTVAPMRQRRSRSSASTLNGFVFVFGGWDGQSALQSVERYNPRENTWTEMEFVLPAPMYWTSAILCLDDYVYLAGGFDAGNKAKNSFYKMNLLTGEVSALRNLRKQCCRCIIVPPRTP